MLTEGGPGQSVTVTICTWNRSALLRQALRHMTGLRVPPAVRWELLIVNNNCSDDTDQVVDSFAGLLFLADARDAWLSNPLNWLPTAPHAQVAS